MTTDVYGGLYDIFNTEKTHYAKINWNGVRECFVNIIPIALADHFELEDIVPAITWNDNSMYINRIPGKNLLHFTKWKHARETPDEIARSIRTLQNFAPKDPVYAPENIAYVLDVNNRPLTNRIARYPYVLVYFPNHVSLLVQNKLIEPRPLPAIRSEGKPAIQSEGKLADGKPTSQKSPQEPGKKNKHKKQLQHTR
jgi:hypothetical protein